MNGLNTTEKDIQMAHYFFLYAKKLVELKKYGLVVINPTQ
jgi:hypothetical protein